MQQKWKYLTIAAITYCTLCLGIHIGLLGPSLVAFSQNLGTTILGVSQAVAVSAVTFMIGSLSSGVFLNYVPRQLATVIFMSANGITTIAYPIVTSLTVFFGICAISGFSIAVYDTTMLVWLTQICGNSAATALQVQFFAYAVGTFVSPILIEPFLPDNNNSISKTNSTLSGATVYEGDNGGGTSELNSQFHIPFLISGLMAITGGIVIGLFYVFEKCERISTQPSRDDLTMEVETDKETGCTARSVLLITLGFLFLAAFIGLETANTQFFSTFAQFIDLKLSQKEAALLVSGMTGANTIGRGLGIFVIHRILSEYMIVGNFIAVCLGNIILLFFANTSKESLWCGAIAIGIGTSTVYASLYGYLERHLKISYMAAGILTNGISVGIFIYSIVVGARIEANPVVLIYANFLALGVIVISFSTLYIVTKIVPSAVRKNNC